MKQGVWISTVEHLLSPLYALGIDNVFIEIDNLEVPILDGSSLPFVEKILAVGIHRQEKPRKYMAIRKAVHVRHQEKHISIHPEERFQVHYSIDFPHPLIHKQSRVFEPATADFPREISPARTFGFVREVEELRKNGLIRGGSLENALVLTADGLLNGPLRFPDEFVRHKILDCLGDISLIGYPLLGRIVASRAGHAMHTELVAKIIADKASWKLVEQRETPHRAYSCKVETVSAPAS
jgi:UDP-3-O-[3-hydroxymyristoyl] N-acetylglucosamine deacetylase